MISVIGLTFDLIGAIVLAVGLFRPSIPLYPGWRRTPGEAAGDQAFGSAGAALLVLGFVLQGLPYFGVHQSAALCNIVIAAVCALAGGSLLAYTIFGCVFIRRVKKEAGPYLEEKGIQYRRRRKGLRFWSFEQVKQ